MDLFNKILDINFHWILTLCSSNVLDLYLYKHCVFPYWPKNTCLISTCSHRMDGYLWQKTIKKPDSFSLNMFGVHNVTFTPPNKLHQCFIQLLNDPYEILSGRFIIHVIYQTTRPHFLVNMSFIPIYTYMCVKTSTKFFPTVLLLRNLFQIPK